MRNTEKDENWREMIRKQGELRHFGSMAIRKSSKGDMVSAQEVDLLFRIALSVGMMTPGQLALDMGVSKTIISRLIESLEKKGLIVKERTQTDRSQLHGHPRNEQKVHFLSPESEAEHKQNLLPQ